MIRNAPNSGLPVSAIRQDVVFAVIYACHPTAALELPR